MDIWYGLGEKITCIELKTCVLAKIYWIVYDIIAFLDVKVDSILIALLMSDNRMILVNSAANAFI